MTPPHDLFYITVKHHQNISTGIQGWSGGAKVLGKLSVPGRPTTLDDRRARAYCACNSCGWGFVWTFFSLIYLFSFLSPSLWETARYRLKYCLKGPLNPKQPTNQPTNQPTGIQVTERIRKCLQMDGWTTDGFQAHRYIPRIFWSGDKMCKNCCSTGNYLIAHLNSYIY